MANSEVCTLYDRKNQTNAYNFLRIKRVHALNSSVSFKPTSVDFDLFIDMLALLQFSTHLFERMKILLTSYRVKYSSTIGISYKSDPYITLCLVIKLIPLSFLLLHCGLRNGFSIFIIVVSNILYCVIKKTVPQKI